MNEVKVEYCSKKVILEKSSEKIELQNRVKREKEKYY